MGEGPRIVAADDSRREEVWWDDRLREWTALERWRLPDDSAWRDDSCREKGLLLRGRSPVATNLAKGFLLDGAAVVFARRMEDDVYGRDDGASLSC